MNRTVTKEIVYIMGDGEVGGEQSITTIVAQTLRSSYEIRKLDIYPSWSKKSNVAKTLYVAMRSVWLFPSILFSPRRSIVYSTHSFSIVTTLLLRIFRDDIRVIFHYHGTKSTPYSAIYRNPVKIFFSRLGVFFINNAHSICEAVAFRYADRTIVPTANDTNIYQQTSKNIAVLSSCVNTRIFSNRQKTARRKLRIGYVGRITREKGLLELFEGLSRVSHIIESVHLTHYSGLNERLLQTLEATFGGILPIAVHRDPTHKQIAAMLHTVDCTFLPSYSEHFPLALLESLATGTPMFVTDVGICKSLVTPIDSHLLIKDLTVDTIADKVRWLEGVSTATRRRIANKCVAAVSPYTLRLFEKQVLHIFNEIRK
jgi:glycosyltransferase involved in cell wall biosynthesis